MSGQGWGKSEEKTLRRLHAQDLTATAIAQKMDRSLASINMKIQALGLKKGPKDFTQEGTDRPDLATSIRRLIAKGNRKFGIIELADKFDVSPKRITEVVRSLQADHSLVVESDGTVFLGTPEAGGFTRIPLASFGKNEIAFGVASDKHMGSKYERLDALEALYDIFASEGITTVYDAGNFIDGEARFNKQDLSVHGMDDQLKYWAKHHPKRKGIKTYFIAGDDHEGWYHQREGINIGLHAQHIAQEMGRDDLIFLGYMEHDIVIPAPEGETRIRIVHAGGGSSYAISYTTQKLAESLSGGDKPEIMVIGHYHKAEYIHYRNIHCFQAGCTQDQTPFMRKKRLSAHIGGWIVRATQAPDGSVQRCKSEYINFYDKDYYRKWAHK
jgi:hypothetical protein